MRRRVLTCIAAVLLTTLPTAAQQLQKLQMGQWLNTGSRQERVQKLVSLGTERDDADLASYGDEVVWRKIRAESRRQFAILFVPCGSFDASALYLLEHANAGWHVRDSVGFDCHYDDSVSVETAPLENPNVDDVFVHHECEERGTGYVEQHFNVFAVSSGRFKIILNVKEVVNEIGWPEKSEFRLRSKFAILTSQQSDSRIIEETQCINNNGRISVTKRRFTWDESAFHLMPSEFVNVSVIDSKTKSGCR